MFNAISSLRKFKSFFFILAAMLVFVGCNKETSTEPDPTTDISANQDAAESVASGIAEETGGALDQTADLAEFAQENGFQKGLDKFSSKSSVSSIDTSYDAASGVWTITLNRERGNPNSGAFYASIYRLYNLQFLDGNGVPQKWYDTNGSIAETINFDIVEGSGRHTTFRLSQRLKLLNASIVATNTHTDQITFNGTYNRAAEDTLTTARATRTLDYTKSITLTDVVGPRGLRNNWSRAVSGQISGTYDATITFTRGEAYRERNVSRTIDITIGGGNAAISVNGEVYNADVQTGELIDE